jgi:flavin-dependent dehydrogenase
VVAGGGPVGLATALYAARAGLDVELREPRPGPIDKACGEGLMPGAVTRLAALGVTASGARLAGIRYLAGPHRVDARFRHGPGRGVRRTALHAALHDAVVAAGVPVRPSVVRRVEQAADRVVVDGEPARFLVAADGLHSPIRRLLGLDAPAAGPRRYGLRAHVAVRPWADLVEVHWARHAEAYVTPVGEQLVGIAVLSSRRESLAAGLAAFPDLLDRLGDAGLGRTRGAGPLRQRATRRVAGRVLLVGDAAGYVDALTGEGIASGLAQAEAAVAAVASGDAGGYEAAWRRLTRRHDLLTHGLLTATRVPLVRRALVPAAVRLPRVFESAVDQLARPA